MNDIAPVAEQLAQRVRCPRIVRPVYGRAGRGGRRVEPRRDLRARLAAEPALERRAVVVLAARDEQRLAAAVHARATGLGHERERLAEVRDGRAARRHQLARALQLGDAPLDPRPQLADRRGRLALGRARRQHHFHPAGRIDAHAHTPRPIRAPHAVVECRRGPSCIDGRVRERPVTDQLGEAPVPT